MTKGAYVWSMHIVIYELLQKTFKNSNKDRNSAIAICVNVGSLLIIVYEGR